jgi:outer membrane receptor for ferrienterochelin and colicin
MKTYIFLALFFSYQLATAQTVFGQVVNQKNEPIVGANCYLEGTYDGGMTNEAGLFSFQTTKTDNLLLTISFLGYETQYLTVSLKASQNIKIKLKESENTLDSVVITAGTMKAGDNSKANVMSSLDIVTTAGSMGDIVSALTTLPGVNSVGEDGRLFVRGGEANETEVFIDGIRVSQPYGPQIAGVPTRFRFSPFLFKGITFSTGGYSAEFGNAMSSVLLLNTTDEPAQNQTDISIMTVGVGLGKTKKWEKSSVSANLNYINLAPYQGLVPQNLEWNKAPEAYGGEAVYRQKIGQGLLKWYTAFDASNLNIKQESINQPEKFDFKLNNTNFYTNLAFQTPLNDQLILHTGASFGHSQTKINSLFFLNSEENSAHFKVKLRKSFSKLFKLNVGTELFTTTIDESFAVEQNQWIPSYFNENRWNVFAEGEFYFTSKFAAQVGVRSNATDRIDAFQVEPRASLAYKFTKAGQLSLGYGIFNQNPNIEYLKFNSQIGHQQASHYILNYLYSKNSRTLRAELFYKDYNHLTKFDTDFANPTSNFSSNGQGFAKGFDLFFRDRKSIKNLDYWVTYSFIDTKRDFQNFPKLATPSFVANHNFSIVTRYWINDLKSQVGLSYRFTSGRPYNNLNESTFMNGKTPNFNDLSLGWSYLLSPQKILYFSVSNIMGSNNVFGYEYANRPDANGIFQRREITQPADRLFFIGFFWTISDDKKGNNLDNL